MPTIRTVSTSTVFLVTTPAPLAIPTPIAHLATPLSVELPVELLPFVSAVLAIMIMEPTKYASRVT